MSAVLHASGKSSHDLARALLAGPDLPLAVDYGGEEYALVQVEVRRVPYPDRADRDLVVVVGDPATPEYYD